MTQKARIYRSPKSAMQSGRARTQDWVLQYEPLEQKRIDPLMGWYGSGDTRAQVRLAFPTAEAAVAWAEAKPAAARHNRPSPHRATSVQNFTMVLLPGSISGLDRTTVTDSGEAAKSRSNFAFPASSAPAPSLSILHSC
jgi:hypothetical protein